MTNIDKFTDWDAEILFETIGPKYSKTPNYMTRVDLVPSDVLEACRTGWNLDHRGDAKWSVKLFRNVIVAGEGLVLNEKLSVLDASITQHTKDEISNAISEIDHSLLPYYEDSYLLLKKRGCTNYGHWLIEVLPKLSILNGTNLFSALLLPQCTGKMFDVIDSSVKMISGDLYKKEYISSSAVRVRELVVVDGLTHHGIHMSPLALNAARDLRNFASPLKNKKIFVSRQSVLSRRISNFDEVENLLHEHGFRTVDPAEHTLKEQIDIFSGAEIIVGTMGAGMTNVVFSDPSSYVVNFAPSNMPDTFFYLLSCHKHHQYIEMRCEVDGNRGAWDGDIHVNLEELKHVLKLCRQ
ncbi:capsular polysaccharide biosynthesis protein [Methylorubrum rhodesianum]|uniref:glycosyltransferase family 61 protein n=1 Tax=Methylorubrum rhodesianum TaxID=29427 RepID=UPI00161ADD87|nr:glycosyltransferase family 61 protein [Methylorubrum rhodesianum]MBB5765938.1 capsular polysaccharide biosynthesis protein [Methylorubrum rhodesianum]